MSASTPSVLTGFVDEIKNTQWKPTLLWDLPSVSDLSLRHLPAPDGLYVTLQSADTPLASSCPSVRPVPGLPGQGIYLPAVATHAPSRPLKECITLSCLVQLDPVISLCSCTCVFTHAHVCVCAHTHACTDTQVCVHVHMQTCMHTHKHIILSLSVIVSFSSPPPTPSFSQSLSVCFSFFFPLFLPPCSPPPPPPHPHSTLHISDYRKTQWIESNKWWHSTPERIYCWLTFEKFTFAYICMFRVLSANSVCLCKWRSTPLSLFRVERPAAGEGAGGEVGAGQQTGGSGQGGERPAAAAVRHPVPAGGHGQDPGQGAGQEQECRSAQAGTCL